jgi:phytoene synthase
MSPSEYCRRLADHPLSPYFTGTLFLPDGPRAAFTALEAFRREVGGIVDECSDPGVARAKLAWWRSELRAATEKQAQHPVARSLFATTPEPSIEYLLEFIDGCEMELDNQGGFDERQLTLYWHRTGGVMGWLAAEAAGVRDHVALDAAYQYGLGFIKTDRLVSLRRDADHGRCYFTRDEMQRSGVSPETLSLPQRTDATEQLVGTRIGQALAHIRQAEHLLPEEHRYPLLWTLISAAIQEARLKRLAAMPSSTDPEVILHGPMRRLWMAWRIAGREKRRYLAG